MQPLKVIGMKSIHAVTATALAVAACTTAVAAEIQVKPAGLAYVSQQKVPLPGKHIKSILVTDKDGLHLLVMTQLSGPSHTDRASERDERTDLHAIYYARTGDTWVKEWQIRDYSDCPDLDHSADFLPDAVTVTDLNNNGVAEVTVPYTLFCGGGVDSNDLKIIMREGSQKFAMRGRTITNYPESPYGGEAAYDKSLSLPVNAAFRKHIAAVRKKVVIQKD
jgi:hypothetical protein